MTTIMRSRKIGDYPRLTGKVIAALDYLHNSLQAGYPFAAMDDYHPRTRQALVERDYAIESDGYDGIRYKITGRGIKVLKLYTAPLHYRRDGICPQCKSKPKAFTKNGTPLGYCKDCYKANKHATYRLVGHQFKPDSLCSSCKSAPRHVSSGGHVIAYCAACRDRLARERRARVKQERMSA